MVVEHHPEQAQVLCEHGLMLVQADDGKVSCGEQVASVERAGDQRASMLAETLVSRDVSASIPTTGSWIPAMPASRAAKEGIELESGAQEKVPIEPMATNVSESARARSSSTGIVSGTLETLNSSPSVLSILTAASPAANLLRFAGGSTSSKTEAPPLAASFPDPQTRDEEEIIRLLEVGRPATTADDATMPLQPNAQSAAASERHETVGLVEAAYSHSKVAVAKPQVSLLGLLTSAAGLRASRGGQGVGVGGA